MTRTLTVEFVKITDRSCLARARRLDGAAIETTAAARGGLPHDLEHLVVEAALDCGNGYWGRVWRGADVRAMAVLLDPRRRPPAEAIVSRDRITAAVIELFEARQEWGRLPVGGALARAWPTTRGEATAPRRVKPGKARFQSDLK
jgi:hypothetical protein